MEITRKLKSRPFPEEMADIPGLDQGQNKISPEHLFVPESKEVVKEQWGHRSQLEGAVEHQNKK